MVVSCDVYFMKTAWIHHSDWVIMPLSDAFELHATAAKTARLQNKFNSKEIKSRYPPLNKHSHVKLPLFPGKYHQT